MENSKFKIQNSKLESKLEHSAGGVVYRKFKIQNSKFKIKYLIGRHSGYHKWVLPKGLIEEGETSKETALREVLEEMGVSASIVGEVPVKTIEYEYWAEYKEIPDTSDQIPEEQSIRRVKTYQEDPAFSKASARQRVKKRVDFFLMEWVSGEPADHDWEMEAAGWFGYDEAWEKLAFADERKVLRVVNSLLVD
jgi:8-oxo-dGTP pyrophosphatase MutT (NUDIX family)